jgi:RHS repeat-associated protein
VNQFYEVTNSVVTKYYFAGSTTVALRKGGTLNFLLADHLGSSSLTTDANGNISASMLYTAWGATRYESGDLNTKNEYTGQRNEEGIGLHYYRARWYDDQLGRFIQADTIVPDGVQGYDRYAYANNNPSRYTDSSGHVACSDEGYCNDYSHQKDVYHNLIKERYRWELGDENWTLKELTGIYTAGAKIEAYVNTVTGGKGLEWMHQYMGDVNFVHGGLEGKYSFVTGNTVHVEGASWGNGEDWTTIVHELGHVWDNNSVASSPCMSMNGCVPTVQDLMGGSCDATICGGGNADLLAIAVGGNPSGIRFKNGTSGIPKIYQWSKVTYGNGGTAEYYADTFRYMISDPSVIPQTTDVVGLMQDFMRIESSALP